MTMLAALLGAAVAGGVWLVLSGSEPSGAIDRSHPSIDGAVVRRLGVSVGAALVVLAVTRWPVAAVGGGATGWLLTGGSLRGDRDGRLRTEAIALWSEMLRDAVGTARGIEGVLVATASIAPRTIRPDVERMAGRLGNEPLDDVLRDLADDLAHPTGDLVVTALRLSANTGGSHLAGVLDSLASAAHADAESAARVEVARERPRSAMRYTAMTIVGFVVLLLLFSRRYLQPYSSPVGQGVLAIVGLYWAVGIAWMQRMSRGTGAQRVLAADERART